MDFVSRIPECCSSFVYGRWMRRFGSVLVILSSGHEVVNIWARPNAEFLPPPIILSHYPQENSYVSIQRSHQPDLLA